MQKEIKEEVQSLPSESSDIQEENNRGNTDVNLRQIFFSKEMKSDENRSDNI